VRKNLLVKSITTLIIFSLFFTACPDPSENINNGIYIGSNPGQVRGLSFSHKSGLYAGEFNLTLTAAEGSVIYYSIDGSIPSASKVDNNRVFKYSSPIEIKDRNNPMQPNFLATLANSEKFYGYVNDYRGSMPVPFLPHDLSARTPKATVIRAVALNANGNNSDVVTLTFFIGGNLAKYGSVPIISLVTDPFNLVDVNNGIYVRGKDTNRWGEWNSPDDMLYNFRRRGIEWEKQTAFTMFDANANPVLIDEVGIRVRGGYSRALGQKSMNIYFRGDFGGRNTLENFQLIPGAKKADGITDLKTTKSFMIRNGGNDAEMTKFRDPFIQNLVKDRSFSTQSSVPCIVYLNGEYWGPYNLQERYSDNHVEYVYGVSRNNVISFEAGAIDDGTQADEDAWYAMMRDLNSLNMSVQSNYQKFLDNFDLRSFLDYWAAEIYVYNWDWPQNNYRMWKTSNKTNAKYNDGKWRYQMLDMEFSMGIYSNGSILHEGYDNFTRILNLSNLINEWDNIHASLFVKLMNNPDFRRDFTNTIMDLYNVNFHPNIAFPQLDEIANKYKPLLPDFYRRWVGDPWKTPNEWVSDMKRYMTDIRPALIYNYLPAHFDTGSVSNVTLISILPNVPITINTVTPSLISGSWTGQYFQKYPVQITAGNAPAGYEFENWTITGGTPSSYTAQSATVSLTDNVIITANYKLTAPADIPVTNVTLNKSSLTLTTGNSETLTANVAPSNATVKLISWTSSNYNVASVNSGGRVTAIGSGTAVITAATVDGSKIASCNVTVNPAINSVSLNYTSFNFGIGSTRKLTVAFNPSNAPNKNITWSSGNTGVATVSGDGTVTGKAKGTAIITVTTVDGSRTASCTVNVTDSYDIFNITNLLADKSVDVLDSQNKFNNLFGSQGYIRSNGEYAGNKYHSSVGNYKELRYEVINESGDNKFKITGLRVEHWETKKIVPNNASFNYVMQFQAGDVIEIEGTFTAANGIIIQTDTTGWGGWWTPLQEWGVWSPGKFEKTFILSQSDVNNIKKNGNLIRITTSDGERHADNTVITIDKFRVYRY